MSDLLDRIRQVWPEMPLEEAEALADEMAVSASAAALRSASRWRPRGPSWGVIGRRMSPDETWMFNSGRTHWEWEHPRVETLDLPPGGPLS